MGFEAFEQAAAATRDLRGRALADLRISVLDHTGFATSSSTPNPSPVGRTAPTLMC